MRPATPREALTLCFWAQLGTGGSRRLGPVPRCQGRQRQTKSRSVGFSWGHACLERAGGRSFRFPWFSLAFPGSSGRGGCRWRPPVSSMDGQDEGGCGWFRMESDLAPNPVPAPHKLCDLGQIGAFLNCVRYCHTSESRGVIDSTLMWYWLCYKTLLSTQSSQQPYKEVLLKFPFHRWAS